MILTLALTETFTVVLINYFLKHLLQHYKYKSIIFIEDDTEGIIM